jgi:hypothetical protein
MDREVKVNIAILMFAFRYALGRQTYAPSMVIETIKENIDAFDKWQLELMVKEINEYRDLGMVCDIDEWLGFKGWLETRL